MAMVHPWVHNAENGSNYALTVLYSMLLFYAIYALLSRSHPHTRMIRILCYCVATGCLFRCLYFGIPGKYFHSSYTPQNVVNHPPGLLINFMLFSVPNTVFYACFTMIILFWAQAYFSTRHQKTQRRPLQYFVALVVLYIVIQLVMYVLYFYVQYEKLLMVHSATDFVMSALVAVGFVTFWLKLTHALRLTMDTPAASFVVLTESGLKETPAATKLAAERQVKVRKLTAVAVAGTACASFKAGVDLYQFVGAKKDHFPAATWWAVIALYYTCSEVLTSAAILWVLKKPKVVMEDSRTRTAESDYEAFVTSPFTSQYDSDGRDTASHYGAMDRTAYFDESQPSVYTPTRGVNFPVAQHRPWESPYYFTPPT